MYDGRMKNHAVIVLRKGDKVLFIQRSATKKSLPNKWAFPSGTMEAGETPEETAVREAREELSVDVVVEKLLASVDVPEFGSRLHFLLCAQVSDGDMVCDPGEIQAVKWRSLEEFFAEYADDDIGHGLIHLRAHSELWKGIID